MRGLLFVALRAPRLEMVVTLGVRPAIASSPAARAFVAFLREHLGAAPALSASR